MTTTGLLNCFRHPDNGMTRADMEACQRVADASGEVIIFRSTGSWSRRWIEAGYPTKNFHVKGKSSDWGPQAGFVPYDGRYSKVGGDEEKARAGTLANDDGIHHHFAGTRHLDLSRDELMLQATQPAGNPARLALTDFKQIDGSEDFLMRAERESPGGAPQPFVFRAVWTPLLSRYLIWVYKDNVKRQYARILYELGLTKGKLEPRVWEAEMDKLLVMTSSERGAGNRAMTGDYDLMAVCPRWDDYGRASTRTISKPAVDFGPDRPTVGLTLAEGRGLDKVLDMRVNTGARGRLLPNPHDPNKPIKATFQGLTARQGGELAEHKDMGNLSGRILRCITALNASMPNGAGAMRRVHHNAESHRSHIFGAISAADMEGGDGVPLTTFQPAAACRAGSPVAGYGAVSTFDTLAEFRTYARLLNEAGYMLPRHWTWGMSIRDRVAQGEFAEVQAMVGGKAQVAAVRARS